MANYISKQRLKAILEKLAPRFIDREAQHLVALADEVAGEAYDNAFDLVQPVEQRVTDVELNKADAVHTHAISDVTGLQGALDAKVDDTEKGAANGVATLGSDSKIPSAQLPALAVNDTFSVNSEAAMLALTAQKGDFAIRTDLTPARTFILTNEPASTLSNWTQIQAAYPNWGQISGTLSDQTDVQNALNAKQNSLGYTPVNKAGDTVTGALTVNSTIKSKGSDGPRLSIEDTAATPNKFEFGNSFGTANDGIAWIYNRSNTDIVLATNNTERGRIKSHGPINWGHEIQITAANALRMVQGNYGLIYRQDGSDLYLLTTASGDPYGSWSALRPFSVNMGNGKVTMQNGCFINGGGEVDGRFYVSDGANHAAPAKPVIGMYYMTGSVGDRGVILSYNYATSAYKPMQLESSGFTFWSPSGSATIANGHGTFKSLDVTNANGSITHFNHANGNTNYIRGHTEFSTTVTTLGAITSNGGFQQGSARVLKDIEGESPYGLAELKQVGTYVGKYKEDFNEGGRKRLFVIAEELEKVISEAVTPDAVEYNGKKVAAVDYSALVVPLINAVKELDARVTELENNK